MQPDEINLSTPPMMDISNPAIDIPNPEIDIPNPTEEALNNFTNYLDEELQKSNTEINKKLIDNLPNQTESIKKTVKDISNTIEKGDTAKDVASKNSSEAVAASSGVSTDLTAETGVTGNTSGMNVKTNGGDKKKVRLGFKLSGYKSIIEKKGAQNATPGAGAGLPDDDIKWLVSVYAHYEVGNAGFNQTKPCVVGKNGETDGAGITLSCWSITQFDNFKELATYMRAEQMDSKLCDMVEKGQNTKGDSTFNKTLENELTKIFAPSNKGSLEYKQLAAATTKMYRDRWWTALLWAIYNSGVKTRIGMAFIARWMGTTGGDKSLYQKSLRAGAFYHLNSNVDELTKLEPSVAGPDKEKDWIIAVAKRYRK